MIGFNIGFNTLKKTGSVSITPVTNGMTLDATWDDSNTDYTDLSNATSASCKIIANFGSSDSGILMEAGGGGFGMMVYLYNNTLYFRCGNGNGDAGDASSNTSASQVTHTITGGSKNYVVEWSADSTNAALYVDGTLVGTSSRNTTVVVGGNSGTISNVSSSCVNNLGGWTADGDGLFTGTVTRAEIFLDEVTSDV